MNRLSHNGSGKLRFSAADWSGPNHGDRGGTYWQSRKTGEKVYSPTNPGGTEPQAKQEQSAAPAAKPTDLKATGQKYAQIAREKWGDQAHAKLSEKAAALANDQSPDGQRKLAAVKAMMDELGQDQIPGGKSDAIPASSFPADKVAQGAKVESEHTNDPAKAAEIARDHLTEDQVYYDKLKAMEAKPKTPVEADPLATLKELHDAAIKESHDSHRVKKTLAAMSASMTTVQLKNVAKQFGVSNTGNTKADIVDSISRKINGRREMLGRVQFSADYDGDEPALYLRQDLTWEVANSQNGLRVLKDDKQYEPEMMIRYEAAISLDDLRRMPGPEASAYAKGVLAMLARQPSLRKEFSLQDLAYLEMIARDVDRYSAGEWDESKHPRKDDGKFGEGPSSVRTKVSDSDTVGDKIVSVSIGDIGQLHLRHKGNGELKVINVEIPDEANRGKGHGKAMYAEAIKYAKDHKLKLVSDSTVEIGAVRVWRALKKRGYNVIENPKNATLEDGTMYVSGGNLKSPAFVLDFSSDVDRYAAEEAGVGRDAYDGAEPERAFHGRRFN